MGELYNPYPKLPKNIRQIGEKEDTVKVYVEDYVSTYLKRLYPTGGQDLRVGLLLGNMENHDGVPYLFVDGAMEMEEVTLEGQKVEFSEAAWKKAYQNMEQLFPKRTVQGWFLCGASGCQLSPVDYWKEHGQYFPGKNKLMYLNSGVDGEEGAYITSEDGFYRLKGYCIYYERNQMMQDYMVLRKDARRVESGITDQVTKDFRSRMLERKEQISLKRNTVGMLSGLCAMLSVVVLAGGIVMFNNYSKMHEMESVIASVFPEGMVSANDITEMGSGKGDITKSISETKDGILVDEMEGGVFPTQEDGTEAAGDQVVSGQAAGADGTQAGKVQAGTDTAGSGEAGLGQGASNQAAGTAAGDAKAGEAAGTQSGQADSQDTVNQVAASEGAQAQGTPETTKPASPGRPGELVKEAEADGQIVQYYIVGDGETLYGICLKLYQTMDKMDEVCQLNGLEDQNKIISGQKLLLP